MAILSTATQIGAMTWADFNKLDDDQRGRFLWEFQRLGGVIDAVTLPASAGLVASGGKYKTYLETASKGIRG